MVDLIQRKHVSVVYIECKTSIKSKMDQYEDD